LPSLASLVAIFYNGGTAGLKIGGNELLRTHCRRIWEAFKRVPQASLQRRIESGAFYSTLPVDLWEVINQHRALSAASPSSEVGFLMMHCISWCLEEVIRWIREYVDHSLCLTGEDTGNEQFILELLCALANDMAFHSEELVRFIDSSSQWWLRDKRMQSVGGKVQQLFEPILKDLLACGRQCVERLAVLVVGDIRPIFFDKLLSLEWLDKDQGEDEGEDVIQEGGKTHCPAVEVALLTLEDYLGDLRVYLVPFWTDEATVAILSEVVVSYVKALLSSSQRSSSSSSSSSTAVASPGTLSGFFRSFTTKTVKPPPFRLDDVAISRLSKDVSRLTHYFSKCLSAQLLLQHAAILNDVQVLLSADLDAAFAYIAARFRENPLFCEVMRVDGCIATPEVWT
jgi:hypothetical protein